MKKMKDEIAAAVVFISRLLKRNKNLSNKQVDKFSDHLSAIMLERFKNHWHKDLPEKGQAYRCIRINECEPVDPVLLKAAKESGIEFRQLDLPSEITLWVDPSEVCCRFGETKSAYCTVASVKDGKLNNRACSVDLDDLIRDHNRKKEEDLNKLKEFTERRSPTLYPSPIDCGLQFQPSGEVHLPSGNGRWKNQNLTRRSVPIQNRNRSPPVMQSNGVVSNMKTGHQGSSKYQWTNKSTTPTKA